MSEAIKTKKGAFYSGEYRNVFLEYGYDEKEIEKIIEEFNQQKNVKDLSEELKERYEIVITCENELQQEELFYRFTKEGLNCRVLTL
ncbi:MAG: hypothetical protein LOD92_07810 [Bacillales bacterium]